MLKRLIGPGLLAIAGLGIAGGVSHASGASRSGSTTSTQASAQTTATATTPHGCPHEGTSGNSTSGAPSA